MEFNEVLPFLQENHLGVVATVGPSGKAQSTVVSAAVYDGKIAFASRDHAIKLRNIAKQGRCTVTIIKPDTRRYVTVEGPATVRRWDDSRVEEQLALLEDVYGAMGRPTSRWEDFNASMREERRAVVTVTPERVYGSL